MATNQTANDALDLVAADHKHEPVDVHTTEGIYATLAFHQAEIKALADYIDGKRTTVTVTPPAQSKAQLAPAMANA